MTTQTVRVGDLRRGDVLVSIREEYEVLSITHRKAYKRPTRDYNAGRVPARSTYRLRRLKDGREFGPRHRHSDELTTIRERGASE